MTLWMERMDLLNLEQVQYSNDALRGILNLGAFQVALLRFFIVPI